MRADAAPTPVPVDDADDPSLLARGEWRPSAHGAERPRVSPRSSCFGSVRSGERALPCERASERAHLVPLRMLPRRRRPIKAPSLNYYCRTMIYPLPLRRLAGGGGLLALQVPARRRLRRREELRERRARQRPLGVVSRSFALAPARNRCGGRSRGRSLVKNGRVICFGQCQNENSDRRSQSSITSCWPWPTKSRRRRSAAC